MRSGLKALRDAGIETQSPDATLVEPLVQRFGADPAVSVAVAHVLGRIRDDAAVSTLEALKPRAVHKEVRREIRRALFRLAQAGLAAAGPETPQGAAAGTTFILAPQIEGYLSSVTDSGFRMVFLARPQAGGVMVLRAVVNDRRGLDLLSGSVIPRKELRRTLEEIRTELGLSCTPVPWEYADWLVYDAYRKVQDAPGEGVADYPVLRRRITNAEPMQRAHPVLDVMDRESLGSLSLSEVSDDLPEERELCVWHVDKDLLDPYLSRLDEIEHSRIVLNPVQKNERFRSVLLEACKGLFLADDTAPVFEARLEDTAFHLHAAGREDQARAVLRAALAIRDRDLGALGAPLLEAIVLRSIMHHQEQETEEAAQESSLIVKPQAGSTGRSRASLSPAVRRWLRSPPGSRGWPGR